MTTEYTFAQYIQDANRTLSSNFLIDRVSSEALFEVMEILIENGEVLDQIKKALFYGKQVCEYLESSQFDPAIYYNHLDQDIVHAIIGHVTESIEMLKALYGSLESGEALDLVNLDEEFGDANWYQAVYLKKRNRSFESIAYQNIQKLKARFPEKFSNVAALHRNLNVERQILEEHSAA